MLTDLPEFPRRRLEALLRIIIPQVLRQKRLSNLSSPWPFEALVDPKISQEFTRNGSLPFAFPLIPPPKKKRAYPRKKR